MKDEGGTSNGVVNGDHGAGLSGSGESAHAGKGGFAASAALAIAIDVGLNFAVDDVAIGEGLLRFRYGDSAVRCASYDFARMKLPKTKDFHTRSDGTTHEGIGGRRGRSRRFLRTHGKCAQQKHGSRKEINALA